MGHNKNVTSLSLFYGYYFSRYSSELAELVLRPCFYERSTRYSDRLYDFSVSIPRCYFPCKSRVRNSLPAECFPRIYGLNSFNSRVLIDTFYLEVLFEQLFLFGFNLLLLLSLVTPYLVVALQPCIEWIPI